MLQRQLRHSVTRICPASFIAKDGWSVIDETTYKDPAPKRMKELERRLPFAWKNVTLDTLEQLAHSTPGRLENAIKNKGGHSGY